MEPASTTAIDATVTEDSKPSTQIIEGVTEEERLDIIRQIEFYFSDANLPFDKFMFLQTSPHLDSVKAPNLSAEAKKKAEGYGPGCSPVLLQTVASFKRMRPYSTKFPTSKLAKIIETSPTTPRLVDVITEELDGKPTIYVRRVLKLEEGSRAGASDRSVYVKGFMSDEDLAQAGEPSNMQIKLEHWARKWGAVAVLRMRRENDKPKGNSNENSKGPKKWKNSVFIEYFEADSAEQLVHQFKQETGKPQFEGRELSSIMFKIDYVTMKANEKGLPAPKIPGKRQAGQPSQPTTNAPGSAGRNSSSFNAFRELKSIANGFKEYAGVPAKDGGNKATKVQTVDEPKVIEYEGNKLEVNGDGSLKNPEELKTFRVNMAVAFELEGEAPADFKEARVNFRSLKESLTEGDVVCNVVHISHTDKAKGTVGFEQPITDDQLSHIQAKGVKAGGRSVKFIHLNDEENRKFHLDCAVLRAKNAFAPRDDNQNGHRKGHGGDRGGRGGGRGGGRDRNAEKEKNGHAETNGEGDNKNNNVAGSKRDAEGNMVSSSGAPATAPAATSVPEIGRAEKKPKISD
ncbi:hypothetical protein Pst134EA_007604 [Puccinia striiformis f. sp. tritici]|uniref:hypothetical protein n=1 Tax=Puccinia striiformis f. sp. tritici TaxID=168172 RepID=UPI0020075F4F|nr:hypothetical protein Pst134EA_007604 [Puccinia striiformis f. sp. tritici]KAH9470338.1 hypothetical protein Pst134EA_007604 [Puccinia striiformis f. sp. tritici]